MDDEFIEEVKKRPELYNKADKFYKDNARKEMVWRVIGQKFKVKEPKLKWFNLRDKYVKLKKKIANGSSKPYTWRYFESLTFLDPHLNRKKEKALRDIKIKKIDEEFQEFLNEENGVFENVTKFKQEYSTSAEQTESENPLKNEDSITSMSNEHNSDVRNIESVDIESFMEALPMMHTKHDAEEEDEDSYFLHSIRMEMKKMSYGDKMELKISILKKVKECRQKL